MKNDNFIFHDKKRRNTKSRTMISQLKFIPILLYVIAILVSLWRPDLSLAEPYHPEKMVQIRSEISGLDEPGESRIENWNVTVRKNDDGSNSLMFFMEKAEQPIAQIRISPSGNGVQWEGENKGPDIMLRDGLLIAPGYPVPCDILPMSLLLGGTKEPLTYDVKRTAGGVTRADQVRVEISPVKMEEAVQNGWVQQNFQTADSLWMVQAIDVRTNVMMVRQMWSSSGSWWLYEETPHRRSWQVRP
jgi:hypothetical protein